MTLDKYGAGCRCLLRSRENTGQPPLDERTFIGSRLLEYPDWEGRPGNADNDRLIAISKGLGLARSGREIRGYDAIVRAYQAREIVLLRLGGVMAVRHALMPLDDLVALLETIDDRHLTAWLPTSDGLGETVSLSRAGAEAGGVVLALVLSPLE